MQLPDVKALKELLKLLRSQGVTQYASPDLSLVLSESLPTKGKSVAQEIMEDAEDGLSPEQEAERMLFYSAISPLESEPKDS